MADLIIVVFYCVLLCFSSWCFICLTQVTCNSKTTVSEMQLHDYYIFFHAETVLSSKWQPLSSPSTYLFWVCVCVCRGQNIFICKRPTLQESSRCCAIVETFSTTVRSRDCVACEMNVTVSMGTSVIPNFLAAKDILTHTFRTRWHFYDQIGFCKYFLLCPGLSTTAQIHMETILGFLFRYF